MKHLILFSLLLPGIFANAQTLVGEAVYDEQAGIFEYNIEQKKFEVTKLFNAPTEGLPGFYVFDPRSYNNKFYGSTIDQGQNNRGTIYEYDKAKKEIRLLYTFPKTNKREYAPTLYCDKSGILYGISTDSLKGNYAFELNPLTKKFQSTPLNLGESVIMYSMLAENGKIYLMVRKPDYTYFFLEFDPLKKTTVKKTDATVFPGSGMVFINEMADMGNGILAATLTRQGSGPSLITYDYINDVYHWYDLDKKHISAAAIGAPFNYEGNCYVVVENTGKKNASIHKVNLLTGDIELYAPFSQFELNRPIPCLVTNNKLYCYELENTKLIEFDFKTKKSAIISQYKDQGLRHVSKFIIIK